MAKFIIDICNWHPELKDTWKLFEELTYRRAYSQVFSDLIERMLSRQTVRFEDGQLMSKPFTPMDYSQKELVVLDNIILALEKEYEKRVWFRKKKDERNPNQWYDALGSLYEACASRSQKSAMGQYFTPSHLINMIAQMTFLEIPDKRFFTMNEPACGSGRFGIATATHLGCQGIPSYICQNDLDSLCAKITAINMTLNGIVGEVTSMNGLGLDGDTFRFGYKICPVLSFFEPEYWDVIRFRMYRTTRKWADFQYVAIPVDYEQTYISKVNTRTLELMEEKRLAADKVSKQKEVQILKAKAQENLKGTLFETDTSQLDNIRIETTPTLLKVSKKKTTKKPKIEQAKLF